MIKLLTADLRRLPLAESYERMISSLPEADRQRAERFLRQEDRIRCAAGAFLTRHCIREALRAAGKVAGFTVARTEYGKPYVPGHPRLHFSLSHSGAMIVYAQAESETGVDAEEIRDINIADFSAFLYPHEMQRIDSADDPADEFFRIWTVREAVSKAEGSGIPLFEREKLLIDYDKEQAVLHGKTFRFRSVRTEGYYISVCTESPLPEIQPRCISPEEWEKILDAE